VVSIDHFNVAAINLPSTKTKNMLHAAPLGGPFSGASILLSIAARKDKIW